jgi:hypothetical protein
MVMDGHEGRNVAFKNYIGFRYIESICGRGGNGSAI